MTLKASAAKGSSSEGSRTTVVPSPFWICEPSRPSTGGTSSGLGR